MREKNTGIELQWLLLDVSPTTSTFVLHYMDDFWNYTVPTTASLFTYSKGKLFYHIEIRLFLFLFNVKLLKIPKAKHAGQTITRRVLLLNQLTAGGVFCRTPNAECRTRNDSEFSD